MSIDIENTNINILNNLKEVHLLWNILDFVKESPKKCYDKVINHLKFNFSIQCNRNCRFRSILMDNELVFPPMLMRSTHASCNCGHSLSDYSHRFCTYCAKKGTTEYNYHHSYCIGFIAEEHPITDPIEENDFLNLL